MNRDFAAVMGDVIGNVPADEVRLRGRLESLLDSSRYRPPEVARANWQDLEDILQGAIGAPTEEWHWRIVEVVTRKDRGQFPPKGCSDE